MSTETPGRRIYKLRLSLPPTEAELAARAQRSARITFPAKGLTQKEFGARFGANQSQISGIEKTEALSRGMAARIAAATGCNADFLLTGKIRKESQDLV